MPQGQSAQATGGLPCTWQHADACAGCAAGDRLMCRFEWKDVVRFVLVVLPYGLVTIPGMVRAGRARYLLLWVAYALFFFFVWEAWVLCRHCPFWAEDATRLRCHANYGVTKLLPWEPRPMTRSEGCQFLIGAALLVLVPLPSLLRASMYFRTAVAAAAAAAGGVVLRLRICTRCVNFSCPLNGVPKPLVDEYLRRNAMMREAWEATGYVVDE